MTQLPAGAEGVVGAVLFWSFTCLSCNLLLIWLLWTCRERGSYLFWISIAALVATASSISQQINEMVNYKHIMQENLRRLKTMKDAGIPLMVASNSDYVGLSRFMSSMRWTCFTTEACLGFFWSIHLMQSVYGLIKLPELPTPQRPVSSFHRTAKLLAFVLPIVATGLLQLGSVQKSVFFFLFTSDLLYICGCVGGISMLGLIFLEFVQTRLLIRKMKNSGQRFGTLQQTPSFIHDRWLAVRVTVPMVALSAFEVYNVAVQMSNNEQARSELVAAGPDLSAARARAHFTTFMPGCLASLMLLLCFGTTRQFRRKMYTTFVPARMRNGTAEAADAGIVTAPSEASYAALDGDPGVLSRQRRLSMERKMQIQVTTEVEIKLEVLDTPLPRGCGFERPNWEDCAVPTQPLNRYRRLSTLADSLKSKLGLKQ